MTASQASHVVTKVLNLCGQVMNLPHLKHDG